MKDKKTKRLLIILNPIAGRRVFKKFYNVVEILKSNNLSIDIKETKFAGHGKLIAEMSVNGDYDMIIAAGGDGTINEVLNGIYPHQIPFGIIPLGTVNVLAKEICLNNDAISIADCIIKGHISPCWLGLSNGHYFALMISAGLDALSVTHVNRKLKKYIGKAAYVLSFLWQIIKNENIIYKVTVDDKIYYASNVIITNGHLYGGNYNCAPDAKLGDAKLYLILAKKHGRFNAAHYAYLMLTQKYPHSSSVSILPIKDAIIECNRNHAPVQVDGDYGGDLPAKVSISDQSINLIQPRL